MEAPSPPRTLAATTIPGVYIDYRDIGNTTSIDVPSLNFPSKQIYHAAVTVHDLEGYESDFSNEVRIIVNYP